MSEKPFQVLVFEIGGQRHGLPVSDVQELLRAVRVVPLPGAPAAVEGVINLRGRVVPVLDVRSRLRLPPRPVEPSDHFIIARAGPRLVALHVDHVLDLVELEPADVEEVSDSTPGVRHVIRVARLSHDLLPLHEPGALLSREESASQEETSPSAESGGRP